MAGDDGFRHGGHADQRCAERAEGANFGRSFEAGTGRGQVDAFGERRSLLRAAAWWASARSGLLIGLGHVEEAQARAGTEGEARLIGPVERVEAHEVDVVGEQRRAGRRDSRSAMPPAALVSTTARMPSAPSTRMGNVTWSGV